jgi:hypothetical protein
MHYPLQHVSLPDPCMEWASILPLWSASKACHLFCVERIWKEMLGMSWHCRKWWREPLYLDFINWWLQWQYYYLHRRSNCSLLGAASWNGSMRLSWAQLRLWSWMKSTRTYVLTMKLNAMYVGGIGARIWFGVLICKGKSTTSISTHDNLTFVKHIYVDVNIDVIVVRLRFMQQEWGVWLREWRVDQVAARM